MDRLKGITEEIAGTPLANHPNTRFDAKLITEGERKIDYLNGMRPGQVRKRFRPAKPREIPALLAVHEKDILNRVLFAVRKMLTREEFPSISITEFLQEKGYPTSVLKP
jgi:hypothetical protein